MIHLKKHYKYGLILLCLLSNLSGVVLASSRSQDACDVKIVNAGNVGYEYIVFNNSFTQKNIDERRKSGVNKIAINNAKVLQREFGIFTHPTPFYTNKNINEFAKKLLDHDIVIYMKDETINPTGSFKDRMPIHFYQKIHDEIALIRREKGKEKNRDIRVLAVSTGNHGRAVAYAAKTANTYLSKKGLKNNFHLYSEIAMSADALPHKKIAIANLGATIRDHYPDATLPENKWKPIPSYDEAENLVTQIAKSDPEHNLLLLHADKYAINGYAVIADEMIQQAHGEGIDLAKINPGEAVMLVPLGSGGILSGTEEISARYPHVYSIGVTAAPADITYRSLKTCKLLRTAEAYDGKLIVDGVMATPELFSLKRISEVAKEVVLVKQEDAVYATALLKKNGINIEPTSGLPLAALLLGINKDYNNVHYAFMVLTGRNISSDMDSVIAKLASQDESTIYRYFKHRREEIIKHLSAT